MQKPEIQGEIATKMNSIPNNIFNKATKLSLELTKPTENIIIGILNIITIILPIEKFLLFNKFIDDEIDPIHDKMKDPIMKLKSNSKIFSIDKFINKPAKGIENKKGK